MIGMELPRNETERRTRAAPPGPAKGLNEQHLAAAPFGAWQVNCFVETPQAHRPRLAGSEKAEPMLTHGRVVNGPGLARFLSLVGVSVAKERAPARC